jgi:quercetin dioxygenase-like cupin family protein
VEIWDVKAIDLEPFHPKVLQSDDEGRTIVINLPAGEQLQEHQVHERAWIVIADGAVELEDAAGQTTRCTAGTLALTEPNERHEVRALDDSRLILVLAPWPGEGHPSLRGDGAERGAGAE